MSKEFLQKLRMAASEADDLLTSCDASDLLDGLEVARDFMFEAASMIEDLESRLAQVERERDAAVADLEKYKGCGTCKFQDVQFECDDYQSCHECDNADCPCYGISVDNCWQWRGVCAENTEEDE